MDDAIVYVKNCSTNEEYSFNTQRKKTTVQFLKRMIRESHGILEGNQTLIFQGQVLDDWKLLDDYKITTLVMKKVQLFEKYREFFFRNVKSGKTESLKVLSCDTVLKTKKKYYSIEKSVNTPGLLMFLYKGMVLKNDQMVLKHFEALDEGSGSEIPIFVMNDNKAEYVEIMEAKSGKKIQLSYSKHEKIASVKRRLKEIYERDFEKEMVLFFGGRILNDNNTMEECEVAPKSLLRMMHRDKNFKIEIKDVISYEVNNFFVSASDTVNDLKGYVKEMLGVETSNQHLIFKGKLLKREGDSLRDYGIEDGSKVQLLRKKEALGKTAGYSNRD